ncbi:hypothetical protein FBZ89_104378 [Nitrospirillum amazonense]|uniref:HIRAN domain-containing protein n=1 Tax=Nitrospirillum amazonense TaxID=28077 RepID=A0A560FKK2_9PROT|nr:hypothetical protein [Nitrospirillum amazonense]TWB22129.1 hypothetical protein FBZ89_104378 [Nitrospirillum amazonense]
MRANIPPPAAPYALKGRKRHPRRRAVLTAAIAAGSLLLLPRRICLDSGGQASPLSFFVAGVRYQKVAVRLQEGDRVRVVPGTFDGARSYTVLTTMGIRVGFVPKGEIAALMSLSPASGGEHSAHVLIADHNTVPWKRYKLVLDT